jgi:hypothetical protein
MRRDALEEPTGRPNVARSLALFVTSAAGMNEIAAPKRKSFGSN